MVVCRVSFKMTLQGGWELSSFFVREAVQGHPGPER